MRSSPRRRPLRREGNVKLYGLALLVTSVGIKRACLVLTAVAGTFAAAFLIYYLVTQFRRTK